LTLVAKERVKEKSIRRSTEEIIEFVVKETELKNPGYTINPTYSSLFVNIEKVTILLRVKNSTAFATDDEFDCNKRWIARSWCGVGSGMRRRLLSDGMWTIATPIGGRSGLGKKQAE